MKAVLRGCGVFKLCKRSREVRVKVRDNPKSRYDKLVKKHLGGFLLQIPPDTLEAM